MTWAHAQIEAVVRRIMWLTRRDAAAKLLVFSTWAEVLLLLEHALKTNEVPYARAKTRKALDAAIADFREAPGPGDKARPRTLLLLLKQGANGLNLTGAHMREGAPVPWHAGHAPQLLCVQHVMRHAWQAAWVSCMKSTVTCAHWPASAAELSPCAAQLYCARGLQDPAVGLCGQVLQESSTCCSASRACRWLSGSVLHAACRGAARAAGGAAAGPPRGGAGHWPRAPHRPGGGHARLTWLAPAMHACMCSERTPALP